MLLRGEEEEDDAGGSDLDAVSGVEPGGVLAYAVDQGAVAAALVFDEEAFIVLADDGVLTRDLRVGQAEIPVGLTPNGEGKRFDRDGARLVSVLNHEMRRMLCTLHSVPTDRTGRLLFKECQNFKNESGEV